MCTKTSLNISILFIFVLLISSCNQKAEKTSELIPIDIYAGIENTKEFKLSDIAKDIEIVKLETTDDNYLGQFRVLHIGKKYIISSDDLSSKEQILIFKRNGEYVSCIDYIGKGPGEFQNCWNFAVNPDETQIVIGDMMSKKLISYTIEGKFTHEVRLDNVKHYPMIDGLKFLDMNNLLVMFRITPGEDIDYHAIRVYDKNLKQINKLFNKNLTDSKYNNLHFNHLGICDNKASYWQSMFDTIYQINTKLEVEPKYHIYYSKKRPTIHNKDNKDLTELGGFIESSRYLFMWVTGPDRKSYMLTFDKKTNECYNLNKEYDCYASRIKTGIYNDMNGFSPVYPYKFANQINALVLPMYFDFRMAKTENIECIKNAQVLFPEKRDELVKLLEECSEDDNPALMIVHLKE